MHRTLRFRAIVGEPADLIEDRGYVRYGMRLAVGNVVGPWGSKTRAGRSSRKLAPDPGASTI